jgi:hypothetical protein
MSGDTSGVLQLATNGTTTAMTIDASQNVGIGATPNSKLYIRAATDANLRVTDASGTLNLSAENDAGSAQVAMKFNGSQMMLDASGNLLVGQTSQTSSEKLGITQSSGTSTVGYFNASNGGYSNVVLVVRCARGSASTEYNLIEAIQVSTLQFLVRANGNVLNVNNSYGSLSDVKLKENIVDATPKLADLMQVKVRNYNLKSDPTHKQLGVIAQELEQVFPAMVEEALDKDAEGNHLETTTKSVKYSVFVPILIKAIQEQQALITAQAATITALPARIVALDTV